MRNFTYLSDKRGEERWLSPWMFFVWLLIAAAVAVAVVSFYSASIDAREQENEIFINKLADCLIDSGNLNSDILSDFNIFERCGISEKAFSEKGEFYFNVSFYSIDEKKYVKSVSKGNNEFEILCFLPGKSMPICAKKKVYTLLNSKKYFIEILTGRERNAE